MLNDGIPVQFFEYKKIKCISSEDKSAPSILDSPLGKTSPYKYDYKFDKETAQPIKNKYIYIFRKKSNEAHLYKIFKGTSEGKLISLPVKNDSKKAPKKAPNKSIELNKNYSNKGSFLYFCISKIEWSKERVKTVSDQLKAGYCKRVMKLPIDPEHCSGYSEEEMSHVKYLQTNNKKLLTQVFLTDYWSYIYDEHKGILKHLKAQNRKLENWLKGKENNIPRVELKTLNDMIWKLCSVGTKKDDSNVSDLYGRAFFLKYKYIFQKSNSDFFYKETLKKSRIEYEEALTRVKNYSVYSSLLRKLDPKNDKNKLTELGRHPGLQAWTEAEYWRIKFNEKKMGYYVEIIIFTNLIINWISKKEFIAMQHDYAYGTSKEKSKQTDDFSTLLQAIVNSADGKDYLKKESEKCLRILDKLMPNHANSEEVNNIRAKDLNESEITRDEELKLLKASEKINKDTSYLATTFFSLRKIELGVIQIFEALATVGIPLKDYVKGTAFTLIFEDLTKVYVEKGFNHFHNAKMKNWKDSPWWKSHKVTDETSWKKYIKERHIGDPKKLEYFYKDGYIYAVELDPKYLKGKSIEEVHDVVINKYDWADKAVDGKSTLMRLAVSVEVVNILITINLTSDSTNTYDKAINYLSVTGSIVDLATILSSIAKKYKLANLLSTVSIILEAGVSYAAARKRKLLNNSEAEHAYYAATAGSFLTTFGTIVGFVSKAGTPFIIVGVVIQLISSLLASWYTHDEIQTWINHCYWGENANRGKCFIPSFSDTCFTDWKNNIPVQLEAAYNILYGFKISLQVKEDNNRIGNINYKQTCINIIPKVILPSSKLKISIWLEKHNGAKRKFADNLIVDFKKNKQHSSISSITKIPKTQRIKKIAFTLSSLNSQITNVIKFMFTLSYRNDNDIKLTHYEYIHIEASLDLFGDNSIVLPGKDKKITLRKKVKEVPWNGNEVKPAEITCEKHKNISTTPNNFNTIG